MRSAWRFWGHSLDLHGKETQKTEAFCWAPACLLCSVLQPIYSVLTSTRSELPRSCHGLRLLFGSSGSRFLRQMTSLQLEKDHPQFPSLLTHSFPTQKRGTFPTKSRGQREGLFLLPVLGRVTQLLLREQPKLARSTVTSESTIVVCVASRQPQRQLHNRV